VCVTTALAPSSSLRKVDIARYREAVEYLRDSALSLRHSLKLITRARIYNPREVALLMSAPAPRRRRHDGGRWDTIHYALASWPRTLRLCLILLVTMIAPVAAAAVVMHIHHTLLCGPRLRPHLSRGGDPEQAIEEPGRVIRNHLHLRLPPQPGTGLAVMARGTGADHHDSSGY
jgi:hypothetical protein